MIKKSVMLAKDFKATFLSCERDIETILKKLFIESKPYSDKLKRLLIIDKEDCLDSTQAQYQTLIDEYDLHKLKEDNYMIPGGTDCRRVWLQVSAQDSL